MSYTIRDMKRDSASAQKQRQDSRDRKHYWNRVDAGLWAMSKDAIAFPHLIATIALSAFIINGVYA